jgi:DNA-binding transcriptional LysR family regulator
MKSVFRNWSDVRVFLAVLRAGSTLVASKLLGMAQPTVARRIQALEHALGVILFERNTRGFQPTPAARMLEGAAETLEAAAGDFSEAVRGLNATSSRIIRFTAVEAAFNDRLSAILEDFTGSYCDVRFEFMPRDDHVDLSAGEADVAVRLANNIDDQSLICRKITVIRSSLFASVSYAGKTSLPASEDKLGGHEFVIFKGESIPHPANNWLLERIDASQIVMTCPDMNSMGTAVQMGAGIGILPTRYKRTTDRVVPCFELPEETATTAWLLASQAAWRRPEVKAFMAFFAPRYSAMYRDG